MTGYGSLTDPAGPSALESAAGWMQSVLLGNLASIVAVIAVAAVGLMLMRGRIDVRRGLMTVIGCFILSGAPTIAVGMLVLREETAPVAPIQSFVDAPPLTPAIQQPPRVYDPYAGASVPAIP